MIERWDVEENEKFYKNTVEPYRKSGSAKRNNDFFMDAYYYGFERTGNELIDEILQAVAIAGKRFHHTDEWGESGEGQLCCAGTIQHAAEKAALKLDGLITRES